MNQIIEVVNNIVQVKTIVDGQPPHRRAISPVDDWSNESAEVQSVCSQIFTPIVVSDYEAKLNNPIV